MMILFMLLALFIYAIDDWLDCSLHLSLIAAGYIGVLVIHALSHTFSPAFLVGAVLGFFPFLILAWFGQAGGADALIFGLCGLALGYRKVLYLIVLTIVFYLLFRNAIMKIRRKKEVPVIPFAFVGFLVLYIGGVL